MAHAPDPPPPAAVGLPGRRTFFTRVFRWLTAAVGVAAAAALAVPLVGYLLGALQKRRVEWISLGPADRFPAGETRVVTFDNPLSQPWDGMTAHASCFVRNRGKGPDGKPDFLVLAVNCAHLGCPVEWFPQSGLFMCPCHGGVYYENGEHASGPPPRGLFPYEPRINPKGELEVRAPHLPTTYDTLRDERA